MFGRYVDIIYWYYIQGCREELLSLNKSIDREYEKGHLSPSRFLVLKNMVETFSDELKGE